MKKSINEIDRIMNEIRYAYNMEEGEPINIELTGDEFMMIEIDEEEVRKVISNGVTGGQGG